MILFNNGKEEFMVILEEDNISLDEVIEICKSTKDCFIEINDDPIQRPKTCRFIEKYELLHQDIKEIIHSLEKADYYRGPTKDRDLNRNHPFWEFIKVVNNIKVRVYIKIKIFNHKRKIMVFSIHEEGEYDE